MKHTGKNLVWVSYIDPDRTLDAATWLETSWYLAKMGWTVTLICAGKKTNRVSGVVEIQQLWCPDVYFLGKSIFHFQILFVLIRLWSRTDLVLFHQISALWLFPLSALSKLILGKRPRFVMDTRDLVDLATGDLRARLQRTYSMCVYALAKWCVDAQTAITLEMVDLVGIDADSLLGTWPSGVKVEDFSPARELRKSTNRRDLVRLVYIGALLPKRNPVALANAVMAANEAGMSIQLTYIGSGPQSKEIQGLADNSQGKIRYMPPIPRGEIPYQLGLSDVGVTSLPEINDLKYAASSPIKLFEYLAAGLPILATRNPCHTHVCGTCSYVFWIDEPTEEDIFRVLSELWNSRAKLIELGLEAAADSEYWTWQSAATKLDSALQRGLQQKSGNAKAAVHT